MFHQNDEMEDENFQHPTIIFQPGGSRLGLCLDCTSIKPNVSALHNLHTINSVVIMHNIPLVLWKMRRETMKSLKNQKSVTLLKTKNERNVAKDWKLWWDLRVANERSPCYGYLWQRSFCENTCRLKDVQQNKHRQSQFPHLSETFSNFSHIKGKIQLTCSSPTYLHYHTYRDGMLNIPWPGELVSQ